MFEVEIKAHINESDIPGIEEILKSAYQNTLTKTLCEKSDTYLSLKNKTIETTVRIRIQNNTAIITTKKKSFQDSYEVNEEYEFTTLDIIDSFNFFRAIGFEEYCNKEKKGIVYSGKNLHIEILEVRQLGWFIEIERLVEHEANIQSARNEINNLLQLLSIPKHSIETRYYTDMLKNVLNC